MTLESLLALFLWAIVIFLGYCGYRAVVDRTCLDCKYADLEDFTAKSRVKCVKHGHYPKFYNICNDFKK